MLWRHKELTSLVNDPIARVSGRSVPDDRTDTETDQLSIPGDSPLRDGGSAPLSASDAMVVAPVQILVDAK